MPDWSESINRCIDERYEELRRIRRHLHAHPEVSGKEYQTTAFFAEQLKRTGLSFRITPSRRGIIADSQGDAPISRVAMRGDTDALPIHEENPADYRSQHDGVMHACGHDAHPTMVFAAAAALTEVQQQLPWPCPWRAVFQPAEETAQGAIEMIQAGALENVRSVIALHVDPERLVGRVGIRLGELTARCQELRATVRGRGGHAARPHETIDPIAAAVHFVGDVYRVLPRSIDGRDPVVVSFGMIHGGESFNVIPEEVKLKGTIRTFSDQAADEVDMILERVCRGVSEITGANIELHIDDGPDSVINDETTTAVMEEAAVGVVGPDHVDQIAKPSMGGEDFSAYLNHVPGCMLRLGVAAEIGPRHFLHSPHFDIDERALAIGAKILAHSVVLLSRPV